MAGKSDVSVAANGRRFLFLENVLSEKFLKKECFETESKPFGISVEDRGIRLVMTMWYAQRCYSDRELADRTIQHMFPNQILDPFIKGFRNRQTGTLLEILVLLAPEVLLSTEMMKLRGADRETVLPFIRSLIASFQPVSCNDRIYLAPTSRTKLFYDASRLVETTQRLSDLMGFDPTNMVAAYLDMPQRKRLIPREQTINFKLTGRKFAATTHPTIKQEKKMMMKKNTIQKQQQDTTFVKKERKDATFCSFVDDGVHSFCEPQHALTYRTSPARSPARFGAASSSATPSRSTGLCDAHQLFSFDERNSLFSPLLGTPSHHSTVKLETPPRGGIAWSGFTSPHRPYLSSSVQDDTEFQGRSACRSSTRPATPTFRDLQADPFACWDNCFFDVDPLFLK